LLPVVFAWVFLLESERVRIALFRVIAQARHRKIIAQSSLERTEDGYRLRRPQAAPHSARPMKKPAAVLREAGSQHHDRKRTDEGTDHAKPAPA
jgi:hypothetical protein